MTLSRSGRTTGLLCALLVVATATPARAAFPGANGRLVFQRELPAGNHTQNDLFAMRPDGSALSRLTVTPGRNEFGPAWNAAGTQIAFWRTRAPFGPGTIWVMDARGRHQRRLTHGIDARDPAWDPTGRRIVFTRADGAHFALWTMRASDGGDLRRLTSGGAQDFEPAWSPDGRRIAFTRGFEQGDPGDIYVKSLVTGHVRRLTRSGDYDHQVTWAPGGRRLVFERDYPHTSSLFVVALNGRPPVRLTRGPFFDTGPAVSPDGRLVAFGSDRAGGFFPDLWIMTMRGTGAHRVRNLPFAAGFPDWRPLRRVSVR